VGKLPRPTGKQMVDFLQRQGFTLVRTRGSHHVFLRGDQWTTVPVHANHNLKIGTLRKILRDIDLGPIEFERLWSA
jgi:predicted RNA binding protein YcfA (HicA-like mRNA interferase family)